MRITAWLRVFVPVIALVLGVASQGVADTNAIDELLQRAVDKGEVPGVVAIAATSDEVVYQGAFGQRYVHGGEEMTVDSVFRIASMTKAITSVAVMQLVEEGVLKLDQRVSEHFPRFLELSVLEGFDEETHEPRLRAASGQVTVRHLLTHAAGFGYEMWNPHLQTAVSLGQLPSLFSRSDGFLEAPLVFDPGQRWHYGINTDWLGRLVEKVSGQSLDQVLKNKVFTPVGMRSSYFNPPASALPRLVSLHSRRADGRLVETPRRTPSAVTFFSGGSGLFSTAPDYIRFLRALLRGGGLDGNRILSAETVATMGENHIGNLEAGAMTTAMPRLSNDFDFFPDSIDRFGLGFLINTEPVDGGRATGSLTWAGLMNTYFWVDSTNDVCGVLMTQILPFYDEKVIELPGEFECEVYSSLDR